MTEPSIDYSLGEYQGAVNSALQKLRQDNIVERIRAKDYTLWKSKPDEIVNRLGWLNAPAATLEKANYIRAVLEPLLGKNIQDVVLLGIGGSSLAAEVFKKIIGGKTGFPRLHIVDTTDPLFISEIAQSINPGTTLFIVSSKSGTTLEISSLFKYFYNLAFKNSGRSAGSRFVFITDEGSPLVKTAEEIAAHFTFFSNSDIGGRYSALSLTGIVPAAVIGIDVEKLLQNISSNLESILNTGASLGAVLGTLATNGRDKLTIFLPQHWQSFGDWLEQLIAESTGKEGKGILPVLDEPLRAQDAYGKDRVFVIFQNEENRTSFPTESLISAGHPVITVKINDDYDLGQQMYIWEMATAVAAHFLGVNPFDQPDVEATKKHTRAVIADLDKSTNEKPALTFEQCEIFGKITGATSSEALNDFLKQATSGDYICLQNYLSRSPEIDDVVNLLREAVLKKFSLPVTFGYGPRYLHSTGQLHKGDSGNGLFIQLTQDNALDVGIPDKICEEKSSLSFGALKAAQAKGDRQALTEKKRRIIRFHFFGNPVIDLKTFTKLI
jgi:glucose-6-phosphate isomerase/transaldolase/glucose-6-phosphate isomerase